ncbi:STAS-like domain-containing protein [Engelhardtia mirabilis]|uniref:DUF4325 domain-containing protein n=1 Tax=Engelhardtia mirabilis TaxID=2528011 RepID=A0A518BE99_9BACT|nr:hypothetical protein Pla133_03820 [Planctomycetes bacterium Pla133]QDU99643.1 hypothetical protein Pla86_03820 [Planctomycetes bacterium Pla86]
MALWPDPPTGGGGLVGLIRDDGIGAFESARRDLHLGGALDALHELSKGKVTTMAERHSGEGLFFRSKAVDYFELRANGLVWVVDNLRDDQTVRQEAERPGTDVRLRLAADTQRELAELFDRYTTDFEFDRTRCVLRLFEYGTEFISRSQAKRLTHGLERFREVVLDFKGVESVGQGFVDEVLRVWARVHPEVSLVPVEMNAAVEFMVRRGLPGAER